MNRIQWNCQVSFFLWCREFLCKWTKSVAPWSCASIGTRTFDDNTRQESPESGQRLSVYILQISQTYPMIHKSSIFTAKKFSTFFKNPNRRCSLHHLSWVSSQLLSLINRTKTDHNDCFCTWKMNRHLV